MGEPKRSVVACDGGRNGKEEPDSGADERRSHRCEGDLPIARVAPPARTPTTSAPMTPEPLWKAASPAVRPAKNGSAQNVSVNSRQQRKPMPATLKTSPMTVDVSETKIRMVAPSTTTAY